MKKFALAVCLLIPALSASAYDYYGRSDEMSGFAIFTLLVMIAYIILSIIVLIRWWKMTKNVDEIRQHLTHANPKIYYLVAIGEKELAAKDALKMMVDRLLVIYEDRNVYSAAKTMNTEIASLLPKIKRLGIELPDYVKTGERFIDYMNDLTGLKVPYDAIAQSKPVNVNH